MPFTRFSQERLNEFLAIHQPSERARQYINDAFAKPSRNVGATTRNVVSDNPCPKMGCSIQAESDGPEARAALNFIFDEDVVFYVDQAPLIELNYVNGNGRRIRTTTTPDFLVGRISSGLWLEERKAAADRDRLVDAHAGRYELDGTTVVSVPAQTSASALGMKYIVGFDDDIPITRTLNQRWLISYLSPEARQQYEAHGQRIREAFSKCSFITLSSLMKQGTRSFFGLTAPNWRRSSSRATGKPSASCATIDRATALAKGGGTASLTCCICDESVPSSS